MHFRLELFVEDLQRSIRFMRKSLPLYSQKNATSAMIKLGDFSLLLTPDYILNENHYLKQVDLSQKVKVLRLS